MTSHSATKNDFIAASEAIVVGAKHVKIDDKALAHLAKYLKSNVSKNPVRWEKYISETANAEPADPARIAFEFALNASQNGGYLYKDEHGITRKWEVNGSGAEALLATFEQIRAAKALPGIDIGPEEVSSKLGGIVNPLPYAPQRLLIFKELATKEAYKRIAELVEQARQPDGSYHFDYGSMLALAEISPSGFGEDPFLKKAALALLLLANHLEARGMQVTTDIPAAAEYRLLQTLETAGVITLDESLLQKIQQDYLFNENAPEVREMRSAVVLAVHKLSQLTELPDRMLDATLWFAGRKPDALKKLRETITKDYGSGLGGGKAAQHFAAAGMRFRMLEDTPKAEVGGWAERLEYPLKPGQNML